MTEASQATLLAILQKRDLHKNLTFSIPSLLPRCYRLLTTPATVEVPSVDDNTRVNLAFTLNWRQWNTTYTDMDGTVHVEKQFAEYWTVNALVDGHMPLLEAAAAAADAKSGTPSHGKDSKKSPFNNTIEVVVVSNPFADWIPESLALAGIIGVYTVFVLGISRFIRLSLTGLSHVIMYEDMPNVDNLLAQCRDIMLARKDGDLELEEELFRELLEIYRSPEQLILKTLSNKKKS